MKQLNPFKGGIVRKKNSIPHVYSPFKNKQNIKKIKDYLNDQDLINKCILLRGPVGCGKMNLLKYCSIGYNIHIYDSETEYTFDNLLLAIESKGLHRFSSPKVIIIHDLENSLKTTEKMQFFNFINSSKKACKVLITSTDYSVGSTREIPKYILQLEYELPSITELVEYFYTGTISRNAIEKIIKESNHDIRYVTNIINGLSFTKDKINIKHIHDYTKDLELDTFKCIKYCNNPNKSMDDKLTYTSMYTNHTIFHNYPNFTDDIQIISKIADLCSSSETFINYSIENQCVDFSYGNIFGTIAPMQLVNANDNMTYPSSNLTLYNESELEFSKLENESLLIDVLVSKNFKKNIFVGDINEFKDLRYPIQAYRLSKILGKTNVNIRRELKKITEKLAEL